VELECGAELAVLEFDYGFLCSFSAGGKRSGAIAAGAAGDRRVGAGALRIGSAGAASGGTGRGSRVANRVGCLWSAARSVLAGSADQARQSTWGNGGHVVRIRDGTVFVGMVAGGFHLVGSNRNVRDVCSRVRSQRLLAYADKNMNRRERRARKELAWMFCLVFSAFSANSAVRIPS